MIDLDVHTHLAPIAAQRLLGLAGVRWDAAAQALTLDDHAVRMADLFQPQRLIEWMDKYAVRRAWVSIPPPLYRQGLGTADALAWCTYVNEELLKVAQASGGRLQALYYLPLEHRPLLPELQACYDADAYAGVAVAAGGHPDIVMDDTRYEPLWRWLDEQGASVFVHPGACCDPRLARHYLENLIGNPMETGVAAAHLVMAGVPGRFPRIRFVLAHAGGVFPMLCGRLQRGFETKRPGVDPGVEPPLQAARRFWADGIAHHPAALDAARAVFGADHVVFGSDWPFPMGTTPEAAAVDAGSYKN